MIENEYVYRCMGCDEVNLNDDEGAWWPQICPDETIRICERCFNKILERFEKSNPGRRLLAGFGSSTVYHRDYRP